MADPEETPTDLAGQAHSRVIIQYREAVKLGAFIDALATPLQEVEDAVTAIPSLDDIDIATGVNLDTTGDLVGQTRVLVNGDIATDEQFRLLIRARIARNGTHSTGEDFIGSLGLIFPDAPVRLFDFGGMAIYYRIGVVLSADEIATLNGDILPRPMGVKVTAAYYDPAAYFGFADDPLAKGFADDTIRGPGRLAEGF